ncbi:Por secretion system C-terminal sorting domain-containing protein [Ekhidna lutea]|uniref:Por secretion system C-terminal sorting domain-containing protein n=1 Tax=Ekhidna lutea TaxID=447679 RepID=A0A239FUR4_EKHLU|nr:DUF1501 domain-containing protein [Ekhidna lutea]SNS60569.1 Por secretion system C-terminal sorting domain-containing protein [Ekhidna lutea]
MKRRNFLKKIGFAAGAPIAFQGVPLKLLGSHQDIQNLAAQSDNDRVLIILQLHGGNDGLNTIIPIANYDEYYSRRANIAIPHKVGNRTLIPLDSTVASEEQVGLHPDMHDFKRLYDTGKAAVFQGVSYENNNGSHFRGRDIWFMGGDADDYFSSGWVGRYLGKEYEPLTYPTDFPTEEMPDPLALEMGNDVSLLFHQDGNIPTSISLGSSPGNLANLIEQLEGFVDEGVDPRGTPPAFLNNSPYGKEMDWILGLEDKSETYIKRLAEIYDSASETSVSYPEAYPFNAPEGSKRNPLSTQLQLVARLLEGGVKTKVFLVKMGGFDTHASQVEAYDPTMGIHSALLYHISSAMAAFQKDLRSRGLEDRVLTISMSEFGRRIGSNGSYGSDHGTGGPVMMFGLGVKPGIYGTVPDVSRGNVGMQFDYRQIYANILHEWMGVEKSVISNDIFFRDFIDGPNPEGGNYEPMDLIKEVILGEKDYVKAKYKIESVYPNPASSYTQAKILVNNYQDVNVQLINVRGSIVSQINRRVAPGTHTFSFMLNGLSPGFYFIKAKSEMLDDTKRLMVRK